jgi:DNA-binding response OmpR family regulator
MKQMKILAAEDDPTSREILRVMLQKWGYDVVTAANGDQAWEILRSSQEPPRLAILDWMMPGRNGIDVCRQVRQHTPALSVYIILLTSLASKSDIVAGLDAGANDYVIKPFDKAELLARIQVGCRVIELQNALEARVQQLEEALAHIKTLQGIIPICMHCHKIRTDKESWQRLELYIQDHSGASFSHGVCPECMEKIYPASKY